jgi:hypothetical protein
MAVNNISQPSIRTQTQIHHTDSGIQQTGTNTKADGPEMTSASRELGGLSEQSIKSDAKTETQVKGFLQNMLSKFKDLMSSEKTSIDSSPTTITESKIPEESKVGMGNIKSSTIDKMETFRATHNPEVSTEDMLSYIKRGAELFTQIQAGTAPEHPSFKDVLSVSWFTTTAAMDGGQELAKGSMRMVDEGGKIHSFLQGFENREPVDSGLPKSSTAPYERFSSHYNGTSVTGEKMGSNDKQFGIESYENHEVFPGGTNCILWNAIKVPGSDKTEIFIKFEEKGFPIPTGENIGKTFSNPNLSVGQKIGSVLRDIGRCFAHCTNFLHGRGDTGKVNTTTWKEHTSTNKDLQNTFKSVMKEIAKNETLPKEIRKEAKAHIDSLKEKTMFFGNMETAMTSLADKISSADIPDEKGPEISGKLKETAAQFKSGLEAFMDTQGHQDLGMIRKGNEVHINPFEKASATQTPVRSDGSILQIQQISLPPD